MYKTLIIDKFSIVRSGLAQLFKEEFSGVIVNEASSAEQVFDSFDDSSSYDLVMLGENLNNIETDRIIRKIRKFNPTGSILIFADYFNYPEAINYFISGANGYITKFADKCEIESAIRSQLNHEPYICKEMMDAIAKEKLVNLGREPRYSSIKTSRLTTNFSQSRLSRRQNEIVNHLILGESTTNIARVLNLKLSTVSTHKSKIYLKLGVNNVVALKNLMEKEL